MRTLDSTDTIEQLGLPYLRELSTFGALSDEAIVFLMEEGSIVFLEQGEYLSRLNEIASSFQILLYGKVAYYKHHPNYDVFTRHFNRGEQMGFDLMIGLIPYNGIDVARQDCAYLDINSTVFHEMHLQYPADFGLLMINLARELSREIALLEDAIGDQL